MLRSQWWSILRQPFPCTDGKRFALHVALPSGAYVFLFLFCFRPFGLQESGHVLRLSLEFGLVTLAAGLLWAVLIRLLPFVFREEHWQVWKEIAANLLFIAVIGAANFLYSGWRFGFDLTWPQFWLWQRITFLVGIIPTVFGVLLKQTRLLKRYGREAEALNAHLHESHPAVVPSEAPLLVLEGENMDERCSIRADRLLYIASADNYVRVVYREDDLLKSTLLRGTLRNMEAALAAHPQFFRCHRTYLVNLDHVVSVQGNAQGYKLQLAGTDVRIPVSRALNDTLRDKLK